MFGNPYYNNFSNPIDRIDNQMKELENIKRNYQNLQTQPIQNIINTNGTQIDFEARILNQNEKPDEILIQRKTAFIDLKNGVLSIKELKCYRKVDRYFVFANGTIGNIIRGKLYFDYQNLIKDMLNT